MSILTSLCFGMILILVQSRKRHNNSKHLLYICYQLSRYTKNDQLYQGLLEVI